MGFLDKLLRRRAEPKETDLVFIDIPAWIAEKERAIFEEADRAVRESRPRVCEAVGEMQGLIGALKSAKPEENEVVHPKLLKVVEQGVPNYAAAMEKTLALSVSEVPGEYYDNCVELIAQITKNTKGPGRYIANVFPAQMKEIRLLIDVIGREVNALSGVLATSRKQSGWVDEATETHALLLAHQNKLDEALRTVSHLTEENEKLDAELSALKCDLQVLIEGPEADEYNALIARQATCKDTLREADADYKRLLSQSANVFRKAVHFCELSNDKETIALLKSVRSGLESPSSDERIRGLAAYPSLFPHLARMIRENDSLIKNKDEQALFSEQDALIIPLTEVIAQADDLHAKNARLTHALGEVGYVRRKAGMEGKIKKLSEQIVRNSAEINDIHNISDEIRASAPEMVEHLRLNLGYLAGEGVHINLVKVPDFS